MIQHSLVKTLSGLAKSDFRRNHQIIERFFLTKKTAPDLPETCIEI